MQTRRDAWVSGGQNPVCTEAVRCCQPCALSRDSELAHWGSTAREAPQLGTARTGGLRRALPSGCPPQGPAPGMELQRVAYTEQTLPGFFAKASDECAAPLPGRSARCWRLLSGQARPDNERSPSHKLPVLCVVGLDRCSIRVEDLGEPVAAAPSKFATEYLRTAEEEGTRLDLFGHLLHGVASVVHHTVLCQVAVCVAHECGICEVC
mmetsp:Transcript_61722/g.198921  ORF Transcript_61722/g.198921 Transcript_61722/m.198921 type:complete len:208 (-) Transcript_61722:925-1548(-)